MVGGFLHGKFCVIEREETQFQASAVWGCDPTVYTTERVTLPNGTRVKIMISSTLKGAEFIGTMRGAFRLIGYAGPV